jgi:hypothetical protein
LSVTRRIKRFPRLEKFLWIPSCACVQHTIAALPEGVKSAYSPEEYYFHAEAWQMAGAEVGSKRKAEEIDEPADATMVPPHLVFGHLTRPMSFAPRR